jgi:hypothetical protein
MPETLIPTMQLRFIHRDEPWPVDPEFCEKVQFLQQKFEKPSGGHVWVDVPMFDDEPE